MSAQPLKVYGWSASFVRDAEKQYNQTFRCIVAAPSAAAVCRITGKRRSQLWCLTETANDQECQVARAYPGVVFFRVNDFSSTATFTRLDDVSRL